MCIYSFDSFSLRTGMVGAFYRHTVQITAWEISACSVWHANETFTWELRTNVHGAYPKHTVLRVRS